MMAQYFLNCTEFHDCGCLHSNIGFRQPCLCWNLSDVKIHFVGGDIPTKGMSDVLTC